MKIFFDTEFLEDGKTIELISIGMVREDGAEYYAVNEDMDLRRVVADKWLRDNVVPHLPVLVTPITVETGHYGMHSHTVHRTDKQPSEHWKLRTQIRDDILAFVGEKPEFWAYYANYDWVALCQLYGRMIELPQGWPMYCRDLKQEMARWDFRSKIPNASVHDALADARWVKDAYNELLSYMMSFQ